MSLFQSRSTFVFKGAGSLLLASLVFSASFAD
jgi:hypothetical protein